MANRRSPTFSLRPSNSLDHRHMHLFLHRHLHHAIHIPPKHKENFFTNRNLVKKLSQLIAHQPGKLLKSNGDTNYLYQWPYPTSWYFLVKQLIPKATEIFWSKQLHLWHFHRPLNFLDHWHVHLKHQDLQVAGDTSSTSPFELGPSGIMDYLSHLERQYPDTTSCTKFIESNTENIPNATAASENRGRASLKAETATSPYKKAVVPWLYSQIRRMSYLYVYTVRTSLRRIVFCILCILKTCSYHNNISNINNIHITTILNIQYSVCV